MLAAKQPNSRSYRIVGPQRQIDERETPHPRVDRGELGERLRSWRNTRAGQDPFRRIFGVGGGDPKNCLQLIMRQLPEGAVNPDRTAVSDPAGMARNIKEVARFLGADVVGITHLDQAYVYSHRARDKAAMGQKAGDPIHLPHRYAICMGFASDYYKFLSNNSRISDADYGMGNNRMIAPTFMLAAYIREMGYPARAHDYARGEVNPIPLAVNAGLGELGRHGMLIHEEYGSRIHLSVVTTDLPLAVDEPVDIGVTEVCKYCMKCARTCPSYSIPFGGKEIYNGVEKYRINVDTCYKYRLAGRGQWTNCVICVSSCCYNKPKAWWHTLAVWSIKRTPIPLRPLLIKPLLWIDDLFWGKRPWRHMKWLDYDNAPVPVTCDIPGCQVKHRDLQHKQLHRPTPAAGGSVS
ncbi:MAG: reductive dehalogenase domain-containing protein [Candidatus Binatota bacterium]